jgi:hypothetical protein
VIPADLIMALVSFLENGGNVVCIPANEADTASYRLLFNRLGLGDFLERAESEHKITSINFEHELLTDVFEKEIHNFQYPKTSLTYRTNAPMGSPILLYDNQRPFLNALPSGIGQLYWFSSPLNNDISNFTQFSLVVPIFYNIANQSINRSKLFYTIDNQIVEDVAITLNKNDIVKVKGKNTEFIPLQKISKGKVTLTMDNQIKEDGFYELIVNETPIKSLAFNYNREESKWNSLNLQAETSANNNISLTNNLDSVLEQIAINQEINWLFRWFLLISILFLLIEMLLIKYFNV